MIDDFSPGARVTQLRIARKWSLEKLADVVETTTSTIHRIEKGETKLISDWCAPLAKALETTEQDILFPPSYCYAIAKNELIPLDESLIAAFSITPKTGRSVWRVVADSLADIGISPNDFAIIDERPEAIANMESGDAVVVGVTIAKREFIGLREFIEPRRLITNRTLNNDISLSTTDAFVNILGVVEHVMTQRKTR